ncbi:hypothetical protein [Arthrobacter sp. 162MFSha1.1]|uniref:hypothetical protein n=1 Tax=Arthrobacter sp. 162MFSha1.1 TaxID=1151119 RepID=UPI000371C4C5|nr:hypothetical protein [Arthrobacter sp. 162MFSha1.1]
MTENVVTIRAHFVSDDGRRAVRDVVTLSIPDARNVAGFLRYSILDQEDVAPEDFGSMTFARLDVVYFDGAYEYRQPDATTEVLDALSDLEELRDMRGLSREESTLRFRVHQPYPYNVSGTCPDCRPPFSVSVQPTLQENSLAGQTKREGPIALDFDEQVALRFHSPVFMTPPGAFIYSNYRQCECTMAAVRSERPTR